MSCSPSSNRIALVGDAAITRGADYAFGLIPNEVVPPATTPTPVWPLSSCVLVASIFRDATCKVKIVDFTITMPTTQGDPILCDLAASATAALPVPAEGCTFYVKALLTRADGTIEPRGFGPVEIIG